MQFLPLMPEIFLSLAAMMLLMTGVFRGQRWDASTSLVTTLAVVALFICGTEVLKLHGEHYEGMNGFFITDDFAVFMKLLVLAASAGILMVSYDYVGQTRRLRFEFPVLVLLSVVGMMLMISANHLLVFYMGLELQSLALYVITAIRRESDRCSEAGLKYFILGSLASGVLLYGISLVYGFSGTLEFDKLAAQFHANAQPISIGLLMGAVLIMVALCFKLSAVPFHMWAPDVYEGAPKIITAFFATAPKVAAMALLIRMVAQPLSGLTDEMQQILVTVSVLSMLMGAFGALRQRNIKRLMAYSSIGHVGYLLVGLASETVGGLQAVLIYMVLYVAMSVGAFTIIVLMRRNDESLEDISQLSGVAKQRPVFAALMAIFMFSMAGIPPMAGFFGKYYIFLAAIQADMYGLAVVGVLSSVVAAYYYLRIVKVMYFDSAETEDHVGIDSNIKWQTGSVLAVTGVVTLGYFLAPAPLIDTAKLAALSLF